MITWILLLKLNWCQYVQTVAVTWKHTNSVQQFAHIDPSLLAGVDYTSQHIQYLCSWTILRDTLHLAYLLPIVTNKYSLWRVLMSNMYTRVLWINTADDGLTLYAVNKTEVNEYALAWHPNITDNLTRQERKYTQREKCIYSAILIAYGM